jgi:hypothetical protein
MNHAPAGNPIRRGLVDCTIILSMGLLFLLPALYNGFPFVFWDTVSYLPWENSVHRPIYYNLYTWIFDMKVSPWPSTVLQSLIVAWTIWRCASVLFDITDIPRMLSLAVFLTLGTTLPWFAGYIMPDIFTALMIIALALLCFAQDKLPRRSEIILVMLIGVALAFHQANLPVALWMIPALGLCALLGWRPSKPFPHGLFASGIGLTLGLVALLTMNLVSGRVGLSRSGSDFLLARMLGDGTALSYLEQVCPRQHFAVCAILNELKSYNSHDPDNFYIPLSDHFLWDGPLEKLGGFTAEETEASEIVRGTLLTYPLAQFRASLKNGWRQLLLCSTGNFPFTYGELEEVSTAIRRRFGPAVDEDYRHSAQSRNNLDFSLIGRVDNLVVKAASLLLSIGYLIVLGAKQRPRSFYATIMITTMVLGNAFTLGALSGPSERYQGRVIWLVPLLAGCFVLERVIYPKHRKQNDRGFVSGIPL